MQFALAGPRPSSVKTDEPHDGSGRCRTTPTRTDPDPGRAATVPDPRLLERMPAVAAATRLPSAESCPGRDLRYRQTQINPRPPGTRPATRRAAPNRTSSLPGPSAAAVPLPLAWPALPHARPRTPPYIEAALPGPRPWNGSAR